MVRSSRLGLLLAAASLLYHTARPASAAAPPAPWVIHSIGPQEGPGSANVDFRGVWTLRAHNGEIFPSVDSSFFVGQPLATDGSIVALILGQEGGQTGASRAGVMLREESAEGARNVFLAMTGGGISLTFRAIPNSPAIDEGSGARYSARQLPLWLRLQRQGDAVTPFLSSDGFGWTQLHAPIILPGLRPEPLAGLAGSSFFGGPMTAVFNNPTVAPGQVSPIVRASAGDGSVMLNWPAVPAAVGYLVRRSDPATPGFAADMLTSTPITQTSFVDKQLTNGRSYRYLVSPMLKTEEAGEPSEGWATAVMATPTANPLGLFGTDIEVESTRLTGSIAFDPATGIYKVTGSGSDIWDTSDHCFFASKLVEGDFQVTARLREKPDRKAGIMIRESLDGPARMIVLSGTATQGVVYQYRARAGAATAWPGQAALQPRDFTGTVAVRLVRTGATVTPFLSADGTTFTPAGPPRTFDPPLAPSLYVGYAVTSQNTGRLGSSTFSDLKIE